MGLGFTLESLFVVCGSFFGVGGVFLFVFFLASITINDYSRNNLISSSGQSSGLAPVVSDACY